jgi:hypothetical protein
MPNNEAESVKKEQANRGVRGNVATTPFSNAIIDPVNSDNDDVGGGPFTFFSIDSGATKLWRPKADFNLFNAAYQNNNSLNGSYETSINVKYRSGDTSHTNAYYHLVSYSIHN